MKYQIGSLKQIGISLVLITVVGLATISSHVANIHLALTLLLGGMHIYIGYHLNTQIAKTNDAPPSYAYATAFAVNSLISCAFSWWFSGIVWAYVLCIYIAVNLKPKNKVEKKDPEEVQ